MKIRFHFHNYLIMLTKRIIPCLDIKDGRTTKGINFLNLRDAGDPVELAVRYCKEGADEIVFLDIGATLEQRKTVYQLADRVASKINIPFTIGGGVSSINDVYQLLRSGADKVSINSAAIKDPTLINRLSREFGTQCIVVAIDAKQVNDDWQVYRSGGTIATGIDALDWAAELEDRGAGEILFTSMDHDGMKQGFALDGLRSMSSRVSLPIIASGGAGSIADFEELFTTTDIDAALAASIFHFGEIAIPQLKQTLIDQQIPIRI